MSSGAKWFIGGVLFTVFLVGALFFGYWYGQKKAQESVVKPVPIATTVKTSSSVAPSIAPSEEDEYSGWKTYTNKSIGYKLRYPHDWTVKEIDTFNETIEKNVKYITITTPDGKYFLHFGLKKKSDNTFEISDRTGMGAGEFAPTGKKITILSTAVDIDTFVYSGKIKEYFYPKKSTTTSDNKWQFTATFSYTDKVNYSSLDMSGLKEEKDAEKILKSVEII